MDVDERHERIVTLIQEQRRVRALELSKQFDVSLETIRKDLQTLHDRGALVRVHGGAQVPPISHESAYDRRRTDHRAAKRAIAEAAVEDIRDDSTVYLDYGTTTLAIAQRLVAENRRLSVITNTLPIAQVLAAAPQIDTIVLGGIMRRNERSLIGPMAEAAISSIHVDTGFFGCAGVHETAGITNPHSLEASVSRKMMGHCNSVVIVADASKLGSIAVHQVVPLEAVDTLITTGTPSAGLIEAFDNADATWTVAKE